MILKDAIKYLELNKTDFITDLNDFAELQRNYQADIVPDNFTELYEGFTNKLLLLWIENEGGAKTVLNSGIAVPTQNELVRKYCRITFVSEQAQKDEGKTFFKSALIKKKEEPKENKTLELLTFLGANDIDISQFLDMEIDVVYKVISIVAEKKQEEEKKRKQKRKRGL